MDYINQKNYTSVCIISIYFGKLPEWIDIWFKSVKSNPTIDFLFVTDQNILEEYDIPNLRVIHSDLSSFKNLAAKKLNRKIKLNYPYKLCDYKVVWGIILEDEIQGYDYWGECDTDVVFGDIRSFLEKYKLEQYDKFGNRGHLTLYRNSYEVNQRYKLRGGWFGSYKEVFSSNLGWAFDETPGINAIYEKYKFPYMDKFIYADIDVNYKDLRLVERNLPTYKNYKEQLFYWSDGKLLRSYVEDDEICTDEFLYIHLQKRKMSKPKFDLACTNAFFITNGEFVAKDKETIEMKDFQLNLRNDVDIPKVLHGGAYKKDMRFYWIGRRYLNLKEDMPGFLNRCYRKLLKSVTRRFSS